jgi:chemotaxis protein methyltransferase CheR
MTQGASFATGATPAASSASGLASEAAAYQRFCTFLEAACGITLGTGKEYLVKSRLSRLLEEHALADLSALVSALEANRPTTLRLRVIDAMTTNETLWFRDAHPFEMFASTILKGFENERKSLVRVWSAACSSGQEAYSISMSVSEYLASGIHGSPPRVEILGTDISPSVLTQAQKAEYEDYEVSRGLSPERLARFFEPVGKRYRVKADLRSRCSFREANLLGSFTLLGRFDVVFCRNVLIYFSQAVKEDILRRIAQQMNPGAYLLLGGSEPVNNYGEWFELQRYPRGVVYRRRG